MPCNSCETYFSQAQSIVVSVDKAGTTANLMVANQGRNIVMIRRILLCYTTAGGGWGVLFLRPPPDPITWMYPTAFLEPGITATYYQLNTAGIQIVQAQAEYVEIDGRARSCAAT